MEDKIIELAKRLATINFMGYPDFDVDQEMTLEEAITVIIMETDDELAYELESDKVYDFLTSKLN
jgi:hypothetical protein